MERWIVSWRKPSRCASFFQLVGELIALRAVTLALQLQPSLKILRMWLLISLLHLFFSWGFTLDFCSVSLLPNYFPGLVRLYLVGTRKGIYTEVPVLCWMGKIRGTSTVVFGLQDPLSNGGRGCWHPHWKTEFNLSLNNPWSPLHALREAEWVSLQMWWEAEMETIISKHFIWWGDCLEKILIFFFLGTKRSWWKDLRL